MSPEIKFYETTYDLPPLIKQQIIDFLRINYPEGFKGKNQFRDWTSNSDHSNTSHIVIAENNRVISHTEILWKSLKHNNIHYKVYGLSGVLTYPEFRNMGYGTQVVAEGTRFIQDSDADIGMFHCDCSLKEFYASNGWIPMDTATTLIGDRDHPTASDEMLMMQFLTEKARSHRADFENIPFYFGDTTW